MVPTTTGVSVFCAEAQSLSDTAIGYAWGVQDAARLLIGHAQLGSRNYPAYDSLDAANFGRFYGCYAQEYHDDLRYLCMPIVDAYRVWTNGLRNGGRVA